MLILNCLNCKQTFNVEFAYLKDKSEITCPNCNYSLKENDIDFEKLREGAEIISNARNQIIEGHNKIHSAMNEYKAENKGEFKKWEIILND